MGERDDVIDGLMRRVDPPGGSGGKGSRARGAAGAQDGPPEDPPAPSSMLRPMMIGLLVLLLGFGGFVAWALLAPLDEGIPTQGQIAVESRRKTVQHQTGGIVSELTVREGDKVKAGQVLLKLDAQSMIAARESLDAQYLVSRATESRLLAERTGAADIKFPPDLIARSAEPTVAQMMITQRDLFRSRKQALVNELTAFREAVAGLNAQLAGLVQVEKERAEQISLYEKEIASLAPLVEEGLYPRNRWQELRRQLAGAYAQRADNTAIAARARTQIAESQARAAQREQEYRKEVESQLTEASQNARAAAEKLIAVNQELGRLEVRAPVDGTVVGLQMHTVGGVIAPGARVMDIVPQGDALIVETQIPPLLIKRVAIDLPAQLRFVALDQRQTPVVYGKVVTVSADALTDEKGNQFFTARIEVPLDELAKLGFTKLQPGMPVEAIIITGERSLMDYIFKPLSDRMAHGMKEE